MIDLDAIKGRIATGIYGDDRLTATEILDALAAMDELVVEVERLRGEVEQLQQDAVIARSVETSLTVEVEHLRGERAAVVAFMRADPEWPACPQCRDAALYVTANAIERGEHRREEGA